MGAAIAPIAVASVGLSAISSIAGGYAASATDKANAKIAEQNAAIATQNANFAAQEGEVNAGQQSQQNRAAMGALKASQGASGVEVNTGSNANVQASQAEIGQLNTMTMRSNAARQAYGYQTQAVGFEGQAAADRSAAKNAVTSGIIGGVTKGASEAATLAASGTFGGTKSPGNVSSSENSGYSGDSTFGASTSDPWSSYQNNTSFNVGSFDK